MSAARTPTPWGIEHTPDRIWLGPMRPDGVKVAEVINFWDTSASYRKDVVERREADVAFIVLACNSFDALTEANKKLVAALEYIRDLGADGADKKYMRAQSKAERVLDEVRK